MRNTGGFFSLPECIRDCKSYFCERNPDKWVVCREWGGLREFALDRAPWFCPCLAICLVVAVILVFMSKFFSSRPVRWSELWVWMLARLSIVKYGSPSFLMDSGVGVLSGSVRTNAVGLQRYALVPGLHGMLNLSNPSGWPSNEGLIALNGALFLINLILSHAGVSHFNARSQKSRAVAFVPWCCMFLTGVLF